MLNCGKKKHKKSSDTSNVSKMAEAIDDDVNNSKCFNKANIPTVSINDGNNSGNGDAAACCNSINHSINHNTSRNQQNSRRSIQRFSCSRCCNDFFSYLRRFRASSEETEQREKSRQIDKILEKDKDTFRRQVSIFVLRIDMRSNAFNS